MISAVVLALCAAAGPAADLESAASSELTRQFEKVGRRNPEQDPALTKAARLLAQRALDSTAGQAAELLALTAAMSESGAWDATPRVLVLRGAPSTEPLFSLSKRDDLATEPCSHLGIGALKKGDLAVLVVLFAERRVALKPFTRAFAKPPGPQQLCGTLLPPLTSAEVFVTRPGGQVDVFPTRRVDDALCATLTLPTDGRHTVEVLARGDQGPQVAGLFFVQVGKLASKDGPMAEREPATTEEGRARVLLRINALRVASGATALARDFELDGVAQAYANRLAKENFFAHIAPDGSDLKQRMNEGGYRYKSGGENLGLANGPLAAHFSIEHSPGHRKNLLESVYTHAGIGIAKNSLDQTLLVELFAAPDTSRPDADPAEEAWQSMLEARKLKGLKPLRRVAVLDQLAQAHAARALEMNLPKTKLPGENLYDRVFAARDDLEMATIDFFVNERPGLVNDSKNLFDPRASLAGIGVVKGDSPKYGKDKFWLVIIYASTNE